MPAVTRAAHKSIVDKYGVIRGVSPQGVPYAIKKLTKYEYIVVGKKYKHGNKQPNMKRSHYQHLIKTAKHRSWVVEIDIPPPPIVIDLTMDDDE